MSQVDITIDFPYDLNNLFSLNYSFEILKQSIEYLARTQTAHTKILNNLGQNVVIPSVSSTAILSNSDDSNKNLQDDGKEIHSRLASANNDLSRQNLEPSSVSQNGLNHSNSGNADLQKMVRDHDNIIRNLRNEVNQLKDKNNQQDSSLLNLQKQLDNYKKSNDQSIEDIKQQLNDINGRISNQENQITLLKALGGGSGNGSDGSNLQSLLDALQEMTDKLRSEVYTKFGSKSDVEALKRKVEELVEHVKDHDKELQNQDTRLNQCRDITDTNNLEIKDLKTAIKELQNRKQPISANDNSNQYSSNNQSDNQAINDILNRMKFIERDLESKLDQDVFDNEVAALRAMIGNLEEDDGKKKPQVSVQVQKTSSSSTLSQKDIESLRMILERFPQLEDTQQKVLRDIKSLNIQILRDSIEVINKQITTLVTFDDMSEVQETLKKVLLKQDKHSTDISNLQDGLNDLRNAPPQFSSSKDGPSNNDILLLRNRMEYVESALTQSKKSINEIDKKLNDFMAEANKKLASIDDALLRQLVEDVHRLKSELPQFKDETNEKFNAILEQLARKADKSDLHLLEAKLLEKLNEMLQKFLGMFADKKDTNKRLTNLEKNMKSIFELMMTKTSPRQNEDDAMFTKKPLNGLSCASCERNIVNLSGQMADYQPWKKLPFREPNDRISKVILIQFYTIQFGPGFSKILAMMKPEQSMTIQDSRIEATNMRVNSTQQLQQPNIDQSFFNNSQTMIPDSNNTLNVEMPQNMMNLSTKNSARTGYQFYQKSGPTFGSRKNSNLKAHHHATLEDQSPPRDMSTDKLPQLTIKRQQQ